MVTPSVEEREDEHTCHGEEEGEGSRKARIDRLSSSFFSSGRAAWSKVHLCVSSKGVSAMKKVDRMMRLLAREVNRNRETDDIDNVHVVTSVAASLEAESGWGAQPRDVPLEEAAAIGVRNTKKGRLEGRGTRKRKRSWTEGGKKRIRGRTCGAAAAPATRSAAQRAMAPQPPRQPSSFIPAQA